MNLKDLIAKMDLIEADAPSTIATANTNAQTSGAYTPDFERMYKSKEQQKAAQSILKNMVRSKRDLGMVNGFYIEAETGILKHSMIASQNGGEAAPTYVDQRDITSYPSGKEWADSIRAAGVEITPDKEVVKGLFGDQSRDVLKIDVKKLQQIADGQVDPPAPTPAPTPGPTTDPIHNPNQDKGPEEDIAQLNALVDQLNANCGQQGGNPVTPPPHPMKKQGWEAHGGQNTAGGAAVGNPNITAQGKKAGATQVPDVPLQKTTGYQPSAEEAKAILDNGQPNDILRYGGKAKLQQIAAGGGVKESFIAESLMASFGILDELASDPVSPTANSPLGRAVARDAAAKADPFAGLENKPLTDRGTVGAKVSAGQGQMPKVAPTTSSPAAAPIAKELEKSGVTVATDVGKAAQKATMLAKGAKIFSKVLPGVGLVVGTLDAIDRAKKGDYVGAGMAGLSAVLSLGGPLTAAASMGLDAANMARDYNKTGDPFSGAPDMNAPAQQGGNPAVGGDSKLMQLQKMIGAKPDGLMGPETKQKLQAWQQKQGITADGQPGPETYGKAGIKESKKSLADTMKDLQESLALIENKSVIKENLQTEYFVDEDGYYQDSEGNYVTDLLTITAINESIEEGSVTINEANPFQLIGQGLKGAGEFASSALRGSRAVPGAADRLAQTSKTLSGAEKAGLKTGAAVARNPLKTAAAATGAGALAGLAFGGKDTPPPAPTPGPGPHKGGDPVDCNALAQQIKDLMSHEWQGDEWIKATGNARVALDKFEKVGKDQLATDQQSAEAPTPAASLGGMSFQDANKAAIAAGAPAGGQPPATPAPQPAPATPATTDLNIYKNGGGAGAASNPTQFAESLDDLAILKDMLARFK